MTDRDILIDIQQKLNKICSYIDKIESEEYKNALDAKEFSINVAADLYADTLNTIKNGKKF